MLLGITCAAYKQTLHKKTSPSFVSLTLCLCDRDPTMNATCVFLLSLCLRWAWLSPVLILSTHGRIRVFYEKLGCRDRRQCSCLTSHGHHKGKGRAFVNKHLFECFKQCSCCSCLEMFHEASGVQHLHKEMVICKCY